MLTGVSFSSGMLGGPDAEALVDEALADAGDLGEVDDDLADRLEPAGEPLRLRASDEARAGGEELDDGTGLHVFTVHPGIVNFLPKTTT